MHSEETAQFHTSWLSARDRGSGRLRRLPAAEEEEEAEEEAEKELWMVLRCRSLQQARDLLSEPAEGERPMQRAALVLRNPNDKKRREKKRKTSSSAEMGLCQSMRGKKKKTTFYLCQ